MNSFCGVMMVVVVPVSISPSLGTAEGDTSTPWGERSGGATITWSPTPIFGSNCPTRHDIRSASKIDRPIDNLLRSLRDYGSSSSSARLSMARCAGILTVLAEDVAGKTVLVTGCGPIGLLAIGIARASGARRAKINTNDCHTLPPSRCCGKAAK